METPNYYQAKIYSGSEYKSKVVEGDYSADNKDDLREVIAKALGVQNTSLESVLKEDTTEAGVVYLYTPKVGNVFLGYVVEIRDSNGELVGLFDTDNDADIDVQ